jgi:hypothetical protein
VLAALARLDLCRVSDIFAASCRFPAVGGDEAVKDPFRRKENR